MGLPGRVRQRAQHRLRVLGEGEKDPRHSRLARPPDVEDVQSALREAEDNIRVVLVDFDEISRIKRPCDGEKLVLGTEEEHRGDWALVVSERSILFIQSKKAKVPCCPVS